MNRKKDAVFPKGEICGVKFDCDGGHMKVYRGGERVMVSGAEEIAEAWSGHGKAVGCGGRR